MACHAGCLSPGWGQVLTQFPPSPAQMASVALLGWQEGGFAQHTCCCHLGPEQAVISSRRRASHDHPSLLAQCLPFREGFLDMTSPSPKVQAVTVIPCALSQELLGPWVYLWTFSFSTWTQVSEPLSTTSIELGTPVVMD